MSFLGMLNCDFFLWNEEYYGLQFVGVFSSVQSSKTLLGVFCEAESGPCPKAALFLGCPSLVSASSPVPDERLFESVL